MLVTLAIGVVSTLNLSGQCTPDNTPTAMGVYPAVLPSICENVDYSETITIAYPSDISTILGTFVTKEAEITSITGLPNGITYTCPTSDCVYTPSSSATLEFDCLKVSGQTSQIGQFSVTINVKVTSTTSLSQTFSWPTTVTVQEAVGGECSTVSGIDGDFLASDSEYKLNPNPTNGLIFLERTEPSVIVFDSYGNISKSYIAVDQINISELSAGVYFLQIGSQVVRVIKN